MAKYLFLTLISCLLCFGSCSRATFGFEKNNVDNLYKVAKIKKVNSWYFIYLHRNDSVFKVISHQPSDITTFEGYSKIKKHGRYDLLLESRNDAIDKILGIKLIGDIRLSGDVLDSITTVFPEPGNDIWVYYSNQDSTITSYLCH